MPYTRVTRSKSGRTSLEYTYGKHGGHNGKEVRNECITPVNMIPCTDYIAQMNVFWQRAAQKHTTQVLRIIQSFSTNELDPNDPQDVLTANQIGQQMVEEHYQGHQAMVFTQTDGRGGIIHNHIIVNDVSMIDTKGCDKEQYYQPNLAKWTDAITSRYTVLDAGKKRKEKVTQTERGLRENAKWSYKDDLRARIVDAMVASTSMEDFMVQLQARGVEAERKSSKKHGEYFTYELTDLSKKPEDAKMPASLKARSYNLGEDYGVDAVEYAIKHHRKQVTKTAASDDVGGRTSGQALTYEEFLAAMYPEKKSSEQGIQDEGAEESIADEISEEAESDIEAPESGTEEITDPANTESEIKKEKEYGEESNVSEPVIPEEKEVPVEGQQGEISVEKPNENESVIAEPTMDKSAGRVSEHRAGTEATATLSRAEKLYLKAREEERKRIAREQDFTYEAQRDKRQNQNVPAGKKPTDFHRLIMDRKEQQDPELGE